MHRQPRDQDPKVDRERIVLLQHVDIRGGDENREREQPDSRCTADWPIQDTRRPQQLEHARHQHDRSMPRQVGWHDARFQVRCEKVRRAADGKPQENECEAGKAAHASSPR